MTTHRLAPLAPPCTTHRLAPRTASHHWHRLAPRTTTHTHTHEPRDRRDGLDRRGILP
ncbi:hypothetical protein SCOCK_40235 [Actinacidiphila cocklensis]|uniref:Uncharacterized protein n=1 Tax=Actinacidiphila cocklensis TaxID=887465 RepID=A0A9W4DUK8_9ACTN|nr:hypothetical protein SCOCK_40235 [Actinacidiphila cocklensis]